MLGMPLYEFICNNDDCKTSEFSVSQTMDEEHKADCPRCGERAKRKIDSIAIAFKGKGFYSTDNRKD